MSLYLSDIFKIFYNYEPSRLKLWEIVRSFDYMDIGKLIFLLENIKRDVRRQPIVLNHEQTVEFLLKPKTKNNPKYNVYTKFDDDDECNIYTALFAQNPHYNKTIELNLKPTLRIERVHAVTTDLFWNTTHVDTDEANNVTQIIQNTHEMQNHHHFDETIDYLMNALRSGHQIAPETNIYASILMHNLGTTLYGSFVTNVESLLLPENLQPDRNEMPLRVSVAKRFLEYYAMLVERQLLNVDAKSLRFVMVPQSQRIVERQEFLNAPMQLGDYEFQPYYQGFHVVVYSSPQETRCYNRYGELIHNLAYNLRLPLNCTFEGVLLPVDGRDRIRSWRYWPYRRSYIIYIVDVYRYEQIILLNAAFKDRIKYVDYILKDLQNNRIRLKTICTTMSKSMELEIAKKIDGSSADKKIKLEDNKSNDNDDDDSTNITINNLKLNIKATNVIQKIPQYKIYKYYCDALNDSVNAIQTIHKIPTNLSTWSGIEERYSHNIDVYDPIVGVVARKLHDSSLRHQYYKFNIRYLYDLIDHKIMPVHTLDDLKCFNPENTFINFEMVDYMQIALVYGHCSKYLYVCEYNREIHQFVHRVCIERLPYDTQDVNLHYKPESIYVVNNKMSSGLTSGLVYIRLYYDLMHRIVGYEFKWTDGRYKIPFKNKLYDNLKK